MTLCPCIQIWILIIVYILQNDIERSDTSEYIKKWYKGSVSLRYYIYQTFWKLASTFCFANYAILDTADSVRIRIQNMHIQCLRMRIFHGMFCACEPTLYTLIRIWTYARLCLNVTPLFPVIESLLYRTPWRVDK